MKVGVSISPVLGMVEDIQDFLETLFAEFEDLVYVEVHTNHLDEFSVFLLNLAKTKKLKYSIHCPHLYSSEKVNFCSASEQDKQKADFWLKKSIHYAKELDAKYIIIHPDIPGNCSKEEALDILETHIKNNLKLLGEQEILIENMPSSEYALSTPEEFASFLKRFRKKVNFCWDVGHEVIRFRNQEFIFSRLGKKIKEIHVSGIRNFRDHFPLPGELNLEKLVDGLKKIKYNGNIIMEIVTNNPGDIINSRKELEKYL